MSKKKNVIIIGAAGRDFHTISTPITELTPIIT